MRDDHTMDYYKTLQVHFEAEPEIIKVAYKRLSTKYHPDVNKSPEAEEIMKRINIAYSILSDPGRRADYNRNYRQESSSWSKDDRNGSNRQKNEEYSNRSYNNNSKHTGQDPFDSYDEFWEALNSGETEKIRGFIELGADVNVKKIDGITPLHIASQKGIKTMAELLLSKGAVLNAKDKDGLTPLHMACWGGHTETAELLILKGAEVNVKDKEGTTPLHLSAKYGRKATVELLISKGAEVNVKDKYGATPLDRAVQNCHYDIAELLKNKGVNAHNNIPEKRPFKFHFSLAHFIFIFIGISSVLGYLFVFGDSDEERLFKAIEKGDTLTIVKLVKKDPDLVKYGKDKQGRSPLEYAADMEQLDVAKVLREKGASHSISKDEFFKAAEEGDTKKVKRLIAFGADVNAKCNDGLTPLHMAATKGHTAMVEMLISNSADVNAKGEFGETPLHWAAQFGNTATAELLISKGAQVNVKNDFIGYTPLHGTALYGNTATAELLIANGALVNVQDGLGRTPLHWAAQFGNTATAELLISKGAEVNAKDNKGLTPLYWANQNGHTETAELLQKHGSHK